MIRFRGVRARLTASLVALVVLTAIVLGIGASWFVDARLHDQALRDAASQAAFDLSVVVPGRGLPADPTPDEIAASGLPATFRRGAVETVVDLGPGRDFATDPRLDGLPDRLPADMRARIDRGELAYAWLTVADRPALVVGGRPAGGGPAFYFVRDVGPLVAAIDQLRLALAGGAMALLVVALLIARWVARGILAPVEAAGQVAGRIEQGDLSARVPVTSDDEFGRWAERFNAMAEALADTIRRLEAAQQQNRRFVADVSHELRTPVAALVAEASIVAEHLPDIPEGGRRAAELLVADVTRLRFLVEELMELSRFDADAEQVAVEHVDIVRLVRSVIAARLPAARFQPPAPTVVVDTDPRRLDRILGNLLDNAREHAPGSPVDVELVATVDQLILAVADRGPGVPPDRLERIFERFAKVDVSRSAGSSGLGLAIAAEHAALLGGTLRASNREGGGLRLAVVLPLPVTRSLPDGDVPVQGGPDGEAPPPRRSEPLP
ncbi:MAG TPA: HAMP domain-containing sensor histidine kinase [Candidatus Saccharimonadales bacterium]|nr:HAMP domain-containing sensor histidine kinase [Candidatus Saccharimonadales bacterium]